MAIISKESFEKLTEEEKQSIRKKYQTLKQNTDAPLKSELNEWWYATRLVDLEELFGKKNLQPEPKAERKYFLRFGDLPENGKSSIYRGDEKIGEEKGISVFECTQDTFQLILPQELTRSLMNDVQGFFNYYNRPLYLVSGIQVGLGYDNEPIIIDAKIEKELPYNKENITPKIRTWNDVKEEYMLHADTGTSYIIDMDKKHYSEKLALKALATLQIAKLIELGYGGTITEEEWKDSNINKYVVRNMQDSLQISDCNTIGHWTEFIAFHTKQQAAEFMSYPENRTLVEQYYMI